MLKDVPPRDEAEGSNFPDLLESLVHAANKTAVSVLPDMAFETPHTSAGDIEGATTLQGAHITLRGNPMTHIGLVLDVPTGIWVARTALWMEEDEELAPGDVSDAVREILNVLTGGIQRELSRAGHRATLGLPEFFESGVPVPKGEFRTVVVSFRAHSFRMLLSHEGT